MLHKTNLLDRFLGNLLHMTSLYFFLRNLHTTSLLLLSDEFASQNQSVMFPAEEFVSYALSVLFLAEELVSKRPVCYVSR